MIDHSTEAPHNRLPPHETAGESGTSPRDDASSSNSTHGTAADLFAPLMAHLNEFLEYAAYYLSARADLVKAKVRKVVLWTMAGLIAAVAGATALVVAVAMLLIGIAGGLGELMGNRPWAGYLVTGAALAAVVFGTLRLLLPQWLVQSRKQTKEKYDRRRQSQRTRFGHDVDEIRKN